MLEHKISCDVSSCDVSSCDVSLCIPCLSSHLCYLKDNLLNISEQIIRPKEVIIVVSMYDFTLHKSYIDELYEISKQYNIYLIIYTIEKRLYAGEARNIAFSLAKYDIISFIDADDIMREDRIYIIQEIFKDKDIMGMLHYFETQPIHEKIKKDKIKKIEKNKKKIHKKLQPYYYTEYVHFGHPTLRRKVLEEYSYTDKPRGQDVEFIHNILSKYQTQIVIYPEKLTWYYSSRSSLLINQ